MNDVNDRAHELRNFLCFMLGTQPVTPLVVGETLINGAFGNFLLDAFKECYPTAKPERAPFVPREPADPLGLLTKHEQ